MFREVSRQMQMMGILGRCDANLLARYVQLMHRWLKAEKFLNEQGDTFVLRGRGKKLADGSREQGPVIAVKTFPQVRIARALAGELLRMEDRMGLSPGARARLSGFWGDGSSAGSNPEKEAYLA